VSETASPIGSVAVRVTLFEDRAEVVRRARVELAAGTGWVVIAGLTPFVDDRSLQARLISGDARVVAMRVRRRIVHAASVARAELDALEAALREAERRLADAEADEERARSASAHAEALLAQWIQAMAAVPVHAGDPPRLEAWRTAWRDLEAAAAAAATRLAAASVAVSEHRDAAERAAVRLAEGETLTPRRETLAEAQLDAPAAAAAELELSYFTPCALWRPEHLARLSGSGGEARLELTTWASAWQKTGESWTDVELAFSTARTSRSATPPMLLDDVLAQRRRADEDKKKVVVEARDQTIAVAGLDRGVRAVDELPGVDDGGVPQRFTPAGRVTLASDGRPFRVEIARRTLPAALALVLLPERAQVAHLRATATLTGAEPLLAGPVRLARGDSLVGRARLDFVAAGEPFEVGLGVDDGLRVRRRVDEKRDAGAVLGTQKIQRTVALHLSNLGGAERRVEITERIPVSEIDDLEVRMGGSNGWRIDTKDGFCRQTVIVAAGQTLSLELSYELRAGARVVLPF
jgi:uncharacterized protein (TIGR02231 family)